VRETLQHYDEALLRQVAGRLVKTRSQWPVEELVERCLAATTNAAVLDRRLRDLEPAGRQVLALIGHSRQPRWRLGNLVELSMALGQPDGLKPLLSLLETGLLYPDLDAGSAHLKSFEQWLGQAGTTPLYVLAPPAVAARALGEDLGLPVLAADEPESTLGPLAGIHVADGLEWLLRIAILWQQVRASPLRQTIGGDFFKRDQDRLTQDPLLTAPPADALATIPDLALFVVALAEREGALQASGGEVRAGNLPARWSEGLLPALSSLWTSLAGLSAWDPQRGWQGGGAPAGNPYPSAYLLALLLLSRLPTGAWARPAELEEWIHGHHPYWTGESVRPSRQASWIEVFLLGLVHQLGAVEAHKGQDRDYLVRLTTLGRWLLGLGEAPTVALATPRTLVVQPNLEMIAYRQGLTPALIARLSQFATWQSQGAACTLRLEPDNVYRALEAGLTFDDILQTLEQHGTRPTPPAVIESLRTWSNKRERISVFPSAALLEFGRAEDLEEALARGLPAVRLSDRLAVVANEEMIDFRNFRLAGTRDYGLPAEKCVGVDADGVTLTVDTTRSDLLLETELTRFAESLDQPAAPGPRRYRLTPESLAAGRARGLAVAALESWFLQRTGQPMPPAARLLLTGPEMPPPRFERLLVLHVCTEELADGLMQWPGTHALIAARLGPTTLAVAEEHVEALRERLREVGIDTTGERGV
jgi:hypothetical protein